jgi:hypothetical protein
MNSSYRGLNGGGNYSASYNLFEGMKLKANVSVANVIAVLPIPIPVPFLFKYIPSNVKWAVIQYSDSSWLFC